MAKNVKVDFRLQEGEELIKKGKANYASNLINKQGGELYLTNQRLIFKAHGLNVGDKMTIINIDDIMTFEKATNMIVIPNGLRIITQDGHKYKFVVYGRKKWVNELSKLING